ncbi:NAD(P)H-dependent glycerol-3-phosphate dehydrogenase [Desulfolutivibrio sulfoxidireducens]|uniref:NAD(P)H-dependent glycerol-3-phosphate dehydrogenase n=1 Tax=Desulfolutivibrio sulfoxidireducens TaxID=2773299 RepID=UPI00159D8AAB|nr:NAD(P)H-dependent glycerol-3-phosphate dehydrogenase [Desulfolutivibrio sulfoxidireducens]QLA17901.1 NAD(P)H-dependent glycerol-3-phosphate dehydrogenase [Desulfolutivibrio sulfoxidireducens]QLA21481.1 NAD(P)H-dependent glycerol-3-phosphate dehydrogenase [Desulfolutivibrio sulfoxidireducens]
MKIAVIGGGSWGTTLADMLAKKGLTARLWVREQAVMNEIRTRHENTWYLPGRTLAPNLDVSTDPAHIADGVKHFLFAVPCQFIRHAYTRFFKYLPRNPAIICASKGIELDTLMPMSDVCEDVLGPLKPRFAMLSGPSFAFEVIREIPTAVTLGCAHKKTGKDVQQALSTPYFRVYTNPDVRGVELGGAIKNIIAIASGVADGLGFGGNARAALITRGLKEMSRLGQAMGADTATFMGLSGLGDLVLTCTGDLSRNRQVGMRLAKGQKLLDILGEMKMVAEGVKTTEAVYALGEKLKVELPITEQVQAILYRDQDPAQAVHTLMTRTLKDE